MESLFDQPIRELQGVADALTAVVKAQGPVQLSGVVESSKAHIIYKAGLGTTRLVVTYDEQSAQALLADLSFFTDAAYYFPAKDLLFYQADRKSNTLVRARLTVLRTLWERKPAIFVTTIQALMNNMMPWPYFRDGIFTLKEGDTIDVRRLTEKLLTIGYERTERTENPGEFSLHGGILDIFDLSQEFPVRIELFDTDICTIRTFNPTSQISIERLPKVTVFPATDTFFDPQTFPAVQEKVRAEYEPRLKELLGYHKHKEAADLQDLYRRMEHGFREWDVRGILERLLPFFYPPAYLESYLPEDTTIIWNEPFRSAESGNLTETEFREGYGVRIEKGLALPTMLGLMRPVLTAAESLRKPNTLLLSGLDTRYHKMALQVYRMNAQSLVSYAGRTDELMQDLARYQMQGYRIFLLISSRTRGKRVAEDLRKQDLRVAIAEEEKKETYPAGTVILLHGTLNRGFIYPAVKTVVFTENDIFSSQENRKRKHRVQIENAERIRSFQELHVGDYVVHEGYGIGIYNGIVKRDAFGGEHDYLEIDYADDARLFVPVEDIAIVQKYASADGRKPKINRIDMLEWNRTKTKVKGAVEEIANELVELYYTREHSSGFDFGPDTEWQREFEETFPYEETEDQKRAIEEVKSDMESTRIMDRLLCGDVGFGKTEVALRAAFKAVQDGKQVAYLVPTTILASQHYQTFRQRMKDFPINVCMLSRFCTPKEERKNIGDLKSGRADIVIGTHKILSEQVSFHDLGLLIIDEEQRFGVMHKEKIKQLRNNIDVLTLTATPIPRTLHMSMIGVRDMSLLSQPPEDREAIQTYVMEYSEEIVREAILREISRGGQVYYVCNRTQELDSILSRLQTMLPETSFTIVHGKMAEREIDKRVLAFKEGEIDVLISTSIIETGIDIPNVNTIIIEDSERYGLAQLYQLRGRVGRSNRQAYAFIMYEKNRLPNEEGVKRLEAIRQFTELGSGVQIAMQDLEIRGAGAVLGKAQSGHMMQVGYDLYCKLLSEAVQRKIVGKDDTDSFGTTVNLPVSLFIPASYIGDAKNKLEVYKRIAHIRSAEEGKALYDELVDRFGPVPESVSNLLEISVIKAVAHGLYLTKVTGSLSELHFAVFPKAPYDMEKMELLKKKTHGAIELALKNGPELIWRADYGYDVPNQTLFEKVFDLLEQIKILLK